MTRLVAAIHRLGIDAEVSLGGRWVRIAGDHATGYVFETRWGTGYYAWCDQPGAGGVQFFADPNIAIQTTLSRVVTPRTSFDTDRFGRSDLDTRAIPTPDRIDYGEVPNPVEMPRYSITWLVIGAALFTAVLILVAFLIIPWI